MDLRPRRTLRSILSWYFSHVYGRWEGPGVLPYYCDRSRLGQFAIAPRDLAAGNSQTSCKMFVTMAMFQARRDILVARLLRSFPKASTLEITSPDTLRVRIASSDCDVLSDADTFDQLCDVQKRSDGRVACDHLPQAECH